MEYTIKHIFHSITISILFFISSILVFLNGIFPNYIPNLTSYYIRCIQNINKNVKLE